MYSSSGTASSIAEILSKSVSPVPVLTATLCRTDRQQVKELCYEKNMFEFKIMKSISIENVYLYAFRVLCSEFSPVVHGVVLVNGREKSKLGKETTIWSQPHLQTADDH